ncbi:Sodium-dependent serotonin transporter [Portunus trituberculatus]|uniref:Sodium-dependent serotonin transporter n=1 Tax=Portunus trituberculatus TaxID=210409 RepID=A0A5B7CEC6_PORTR|nr:Sodium-dependent serotonin transporter [Portunus trituberculatus]
MANVQNKDISEVGEEGELRLLVSLYRLSILSIHEEMTVVAIATMTGSVFWSIIFFLMLITLGLDSTFGGLEAMITGLCDEYPRFLGCHRELFVLGLLVFIYICALPTTTYGGMYIVDLLNVFGTGNPILFIVFVEAMARIKAMIKPEEYVPPQLSQVNPNYGTHV